MTAPKALWKITDPEKASACADDGSSLNRYKGIMSKHETWRTIRYWESIGGLLIKEYMVTINSLLTLVTVCSGIRGTS